VARAGCRLKARNGVVSFGRNSARTEKDLPGNKEEGQYSWARACTGPRCNAEKKPDAQGSLKTQGVKRSVRVPERAAHWHGERGLSRYRGTLIVTLKGVETKILCRVLINADRRGGTRRVGKIGCLSKRRNQNLSQLKTKGLGGGLDPVVEV